MTVWLIRSSAYQTVLQGTVKVKKRKGRQRKRREGNTKMWTGMDLASSTIAAEDSP